MNPVNTSSRPTIRTPVREPKPRPRLDPMLAVWALAFLAVLFGLLQGAERFRNGWNPIAADAQAEQAPNQIVGQGEVMQAPALVEERMLHVCKDAKGRPVKQDAPCADTGKNGSKKTP